MLIRCDSDPPLQLHTRNASVPGNPFIKHYGFSNEHAHIWVDEWTSNGFTLGILKSGQINQPVFLFANPEKAILVINLPGNTKKSSVNQYPCAVLLAGITGNHPARIENGHRIILYIGYPQQLLSLLCESLKREISPLLNTRITLSKRFEKQASRLLTLLPLKPWPMVEINIACYRLLELFLKEAFRSQRHLQWLQNNQLRIRDLPSFIDAHLPAGNNHLLTTHHLSKQIGMSSYAFSRLFMQVFKQPFTQYVLRKRMEHAENQLKHSSLPIRDIAYACGYADFSSFTRAFKNYFHYTPSSLRR